MLHHDVIEVIVRGLIGELTVALAPEGNVSAAVLRGRLEHELTFRGGTRLCMRPKRQRLSAEGSLELALPRGMTLTFVDCHGKWVRPDGEVHELNGGCVAWTAA